MNSRDRMNSEAIMNSNVSTDDKMSMRSEVSTDLIDATNFPEEPKLGFLSRVELAVTRAAIDAANRIRSSRIKEKLAEERGDVPGWVLVVLMTTGLVTAIWTIAAPRLTTILKESLDAMNGVR